MKLVRLQDSTVAEILPEGARPPEDWYPPEFCAKCREAPDEVSQGWAFDPETEAFAPPPVAEPEPDGPDGAVTAEEALSIILGSETDDQA